MKNLETRKINEEPTYEISSRAVGEVVRIPEESSKKISADTSISSILKKGDEE